MQAPFATGRPHEAPVLQCGSCWAVAAVTCIEASFARQISEDMPPLSVQQVVDACIPSRGYPDCDMCQGGHVEAAVRYAT